MMERTVVIHIVQFHHQLGCRLVAWWLCQPPFMATNIVRLPDSRMYALWPQAMGCHLAMIAMIA